MSLKELQYGSPAEQEIAVEARYAPRSRFPHQPAACSRADDGRSAFASSHQPERLLSRQEGRQDQERVGLRLAPVTGQSRDRPSHSAKQGRFAPPLMAI